MNQGETIAPEQAYKEFVDLRGGLQQEAEIAQAHSSLVNARGLAANYLKERGGYDDEQIANVVENPELLGKTLEDRLKLGGSRAQNYFEANLPQMVRGVGQNGLEASLILDAPNGDNKERSEAIRKYSVFNAALQGDKKALKEAEGILRKEYVDDQLVKAEKALSGDEYIDEKTVENTLESLRGINEIELEINFRKDAEGLLMKYLESSKEKFDSTFEDAGERQAYLENRIVELAGKDEKGAAQVSEFLYQLANNGN